jgi:hypothetical protein
MKTEVYSWRVSTDLKMGLEREARRRNTSLAVVLDLAAREWLSKSSAQDEEEAEQLRLHEAASKWLGALASNNAHRSERVRQTLRRRLLWPL